MKLVRIFSLLACVVMGLSEVHAQVPEPVQVSEHVYIGHALNALDLSYKPNAKYVGVYMVVNEGYPHSPDTMIQFVKRYFDGYNIPAIFVKQRKPRPGNQFSMVFYIDGWAFHGDLSDGNVSLVELRDNHQSLFKRISRRYADVNPDVEFISGD